MKSHSFDNVIAIDGPAASGKSTVAQRVAEKLGGYYVSTGNMYRAITLFAIQNKIELESQKLELEIVPLLGKMELAYRKSPLGGLELVMNGKVVDNAIRAPEVARYVSKIAALEKVRLWLRDKQRSLSCLGLVVMEGRDIGTVIFPDAKHKFFLTASAKVRAIRRLKQAGEIPAGATVASVTKEIMARDEMDMNRSVAPLKKADDAILIDSDNMTIEEAVDSIVKKILASSP